MGNYMLWIKKIIIILILGSLSVCLPMFSYGQNVTEDNELEVRTLFIPNAFTPNNDGVNDIFKIVNLENEQVLQFKIFNKWGVTVYDNASNDAYWDGTYKGKLQEQGEYGYVIAVKFPNGITEVYKGIIVLLTN
jgi:gliding motility-associated-like protein